ncbi:hypothetical protein [Anthocerotibacter panamensis]|uniref:hypothetical protein n=1 Tax=Anthocerotibacter panamensis TaxID=2857077 RepID=UPI001C408917|nr:hypothetical protein [Anthocerotibacter panamensis]
MSGKRSNRSKTPRFACPECHNRLWRLNSPRHHLFYDGAEEIAQNTQCSHHKARLLASRGTYIDQRRWLEEFFCEAHGRMWLRITLDDSGQIQSTVPTPGDWKRTTGTIHPDISNPSVSEYTRRMSRRATPQG